jgi:hypothetical protein
MKKEAKYRSFSKKIGAPVTHLRVDSYDSVVCFHNGHSHDRQQKIEVDYSSIIFESG